MPHLIRSSIVLFSVVAALAARAEEPAATQTEGDELFEALGAIDQMTLADLLNSETSVATVAPQSVRSAPGIITVITREEIQSSGARDLMDVLNLVAGFGFAQDVAGVTGVGFRGLWNEGKVLFQIDGHDLNEPLYVTMPLGNEFPVDQISKIEIIRGPGSVIYGGAAEVAVINVVTRRGEEVHGASATARYSVLGSSWGRRTASVTFGDKVEDSGLTFAGSVFLGEARRDTGTQSDFVGHTYSASRDSGLNPTLINFNATYKDLSIGFLHRDYRVVDRSGFDEVLPRSATVSFESTHLNASYALRLGETATLTPRLRYSRHQPWRVVDDDPAVRSALYYDKSADRYDGGLTLTWDPAKQVNVVVGAVAYVDLARLNDPGANGENIVGLNQPFGTENSVHYWDVATYAQVLFRNPIADLTAGARYEQHEVFGGSFVPRAALTRVFGNLHLKALAAGAFRAPGIESMALNPDIEPERTWAWELESGYLFNDNLYAAVNLFNLSISGPIVYGYDSATDSERYLNGSKTGTSGLEAELRYRRARGSVTLNYAFYTAAGQNEIDLYRAPDRQSLLGFANHKATLSGRYEVLPKLTLASSLIALGPRYGVGGINADGTSRLDRFGPTFLWNAFATYSGPRLRGISVGLGVHNILGQEFQFLQAYDAGKPPLRGWGRELALTVGYDM